MATILVVDDIEASREALISLLRSYGHRLLEAVNGREALSMANAEPPDLVITDVLMPIMDGYELVRQLRRHPATGMVPVVFYTAHYGELEARALALQGGVAAVLTKPTDHTEVLAAVARALAGTARWELPGAGPLNPEFDDAHLRLVTDKLSQTEEDLRIANARSKALLNIGLELASERDGYRLLQNVCVSTRELFGASYVTLGVLDQPHGTIRELVTSGVHTGGWMKAGDTVSGILAAVVAERRPVRKRNPGGDPAALQLPASHPPVDACLIVPIASPACVYGWICLVGNEGQAFSETDEQLVLVLGGQVGRICENARVQETARQERDRAQRYLDIAEVVLLALDLEGRITLINRKGCDLLEWSEHELLGRDWIETCIPARLRGGLRTTFSNLVGGDLSIREHHVVARSGRERLIEWRNTLLRDDAGRVTGTFSCGTDITEQHAALEALQVTEERMRFALESAGVGIWDMDYATGILRWSETLEAQYGLPPGTFGGTFDEFVELVHPEDRARLLETLNTAKTSGSDFHVDNRALWPDGAVRWLTGAGRVLLGEHGNAVRGVGISMDDTERHTLEQQYHQAQKMEAVGRLAGGVAHDFNNLLTAILGYCELLLSDRTPADPDFADIGEIHRAGLRAAGLTRQLLAFSRKQIIEPTLLDLNIVVAELRPMLERLIGEDVNVVMRLGPELALVKADHGQLDQVVMNLAVNARDAMPRGGTLTIETANVELDEHYAKAHVGVTPGPYVALTVTDTGSGMTPQVLGRLFEPFFTTKEPGKGTGLGMATVHGIVMRARGSVGVDTDLGRGTSFKVYLPKADTTEPTADAQRVPVPALHGTETVLVVEDADGLRGLTKRLLERQGYSVLVAANSDEALRLFNQHASIDVLLTDVVMPGPSGADLTRQLLEQRPSLHVVYMSGYTEDAITVHGVLKPGIAFLHKPFDSETLGRKIREVLDA